MILGEEEAALETVAVGAPLGAMARREPGSQHLNLANELIALEDLVGESREAKVEVVLDAGVLQTLWLGDRRPDLGEILDQRCSEVRERRSP